MNGSAVGTCEPMCAWRPRKRTFASDEAAAIVAGATAAGTPNAVDSWPVAMDSCVSTRTPGFTRSRNGCTMPAASANASTRRSSSRAVGDQQSHARPDRQLQLVVGLVAPVERDPRRARPRRACTPRPRPRSQRAGRAPRPRPAGASRARRTPSRRRTSSGTRASPSGAERPDPIDRTPATACRSVRPAPRHSAPRSTCRRLGTTRSRARGPGRRPRSHRPPESRSRPTPSAQPSTRSMASGADTPSSPSRFAMTCFVPEASQRRACVSASSSETTRHSA